MKHFIKYKIVYLILTILFLIGSFNYLFYKTQLSEEKNKENLTNSKIENESCPNLVTEVFDGFLKILEDDRIVLSQEENEGYKDIEFKLTAETKFFRILIEDEIIIKEEEIDKNVFKEFDDQFDDQIEVSFLSIIATCIDGADEFCQAIKVREIPNNISN